MNKLLGVLLLWSCICTLLAEEAVVTLNSSVIGNQEQPKVLYLLPWQAAADNMEPLQPFSAKVGTQPDFLEPDEFSRELDYKRQHQQSKQVEN